LEPDKSKHVFHVRTKRHAGLFADIIAAFSDDERRLWERSTEEGEYTGWTRRVPEDTNAD